MLADIYGRYSSGEQSEGDSETRQMRMATDFCQRHGLDISGIYFDRGLSGYHSKNVECGELGAYLAAVKDGTIKGPRVLVFEQLNRFRRARPDKVVATLSQLMEAGIKIGVCVFDDVLTVDDFGSWKWNQLAGAIGQAFMDSDQKSKWKKSSWQKKWASATPVRHTCPSWIRWDKKVGGYALIPDQADLLRKAVDLSIAGHGGAEICRRLGVDWLNITAIMRQRTLLGEYQPRTRTDTLGKRKSAANAKPGYYPALITEGKFNKLQAALDSRKTAKGRRGKYVTNLFRDLIHDATDGERMVIYRTARGEVVLKSRRLGTGRKQLHYGLVEKALLDFLQEVTPEDLLPKQEKNGDLERLTGHLAGMTHEAAELVDSPSGATPGKLLAARLNRLDADIEKCRREIDALKRSQAHQDSDRLREAKSVAQLLASTSGDELLSLRLKLRDCIHSVVSEIWVRVLTSQRAEIQLFKGDRVVQIFLNGDESAWSIEGPAGFASGIHDLRQYRHNGGDKRRDARVANICGGTKKRRLTA